MSAVQVKKRKTNWYKSNLNFYITKGEIKMKKFFVAAFAVLVAGVVCADAVVADFLSEANWRRSRVKGSYAAVKENGKVSAIKVNGPNVVSFGSRIYPMDGGKDINKLYEGISFEVKGDGSNEWGAVAVQETNLVCGIYFFPLKNTEWHEVKVAFADMAPASDHTLGLPAKLAVGRIVNVNFGDRWKLNWTNVKRGEFSFQVRNLKLVENAAPAIKTGKLKARPLCDVIKEMKAGKPALVTCVGDSITAGTALKKGDKRYAVLLGELLVKKFNNAKIKRECVAIGGAHTFDSIAWLDRDLTKGNPDVATMLIGFNNRSGAQSTAAYVAQLEMWIERLLAKTNGKTAIILIPSIQGVPRWEAQKDMAEATYKVAKKYNCTICPIEQVIEKIGALQYKAKYLADGVHPNQAGHKMFAEELVKCFDK